LAARLQEALAPVASSVRSLTCYTPTQLASPLPYSIDTVSVSWSQRQAVDPDGIWLRGSGLTVLSRGERFAKDLSSILLVLYFIA
jgi:hypothetical protein